MLESWVGSEQDCSVLAESMLMYPRTLSSSAFPEPFSAYIYVKSASNRENSVYSLVIPLDLFLFLFSSSPLPLVVVSSLQGTNKESPTILSLLQPMKRAEVSEKPVPSFHTLPTRSTGFGRTPKVSKATWAKHFRPFQPRQCTHSTGFYAALAFWNVKRPCQ